MNKRKMTLAVVAAALVGAGAVYGAGRAGRCRRLAIADGYRAVTLPVHESQLSRAMPGDSVDVLVTIEAVLGKGTQKENVTTTLLQNVRVLGVPGRGSIELMLNPHEVQYAALSADSKAPLWISVRKKGDSFMEPMPMATFRKLMR